MYKVTLNTIRIISLSAIILLASCTNKEDSKNDDKSRKRADFASYQTDEKLDKEQETNKEANEEIMRVVESIRRLIPDTPDKNQYLFKKVEFVPDKDLYMYIITDAEQPAGKIDEKALANFKSKLVKEVSEEMNWYIFRKHSVTIHFKFYDKEMKNEVYEIVVTPEDYK